MTIEQRIEKTETKSTAMDPCSDCPRIKSSNLGVNECLSCNYWTTKVTADARGRLDQKIRGKK